MKMTLLVALLMFATDFQQGKTRYLFEDGPKLKTQRLIYQLQIKMNALILRHATFRTTKAENTENGMEMPILYYGMMMKHK